MARARSSFFCSTSLAYLPGGDCLSGFLLIFRFRSHKADAGSASCAPRPCLSCLTCLACFPDTSASDGLPTIWGAASLSRFIFLPRLFSCLFTRWRVRRWRCLCWGRLSPSLGRDSSPARGSLAAKSFLLVCGLVPWVLPTTERAL